MAPEITFTPHPQATHRIDGVALEAARSALKRQIASPPWNEEVTIDAVRQWCRGIADMNRLYSEPGYCFGSRGVEGLAPSLFAATASSGPLFPFSGNGEADDSFRILAGTNPGAGYLLTSDEWRFPDELRLGMRINSSQRLESVDIDEDPFWGAVLREEWSYEYKLVDTNEICATRMAVYHRFGASPPKASNGRSWPSKYRYSAEELAEIADRYRYEQVRGGDPRWWQDVRAGDSVGQVTKGPLTTTEIGTYLVGAGNRLVLTDEIAHAFLAECPGWFVREGDIKSWDVITRIHWDDAFARWRGLPAAIAPGDQLLGWFDHLVNNWKSDFGVTRRISYQMGEPIFVADSATLTGYVRRKYLDEGRPLVDLELVATDQRGRLLGKVAAAIQLPTRGAPDARHAAEVSR